MKKFEELKALLASAEKDATAFYEKNNKPAWTRLRVALQNAKVLAQDVRNEVTAKKNAK